MPIDKRLIFYSGRHVLLKALSEEDIVESNWVGWFNSELLSEHNQHHYFPNTFELQREHLRNAISSQKLQLGIVDRANDEKICGVVSFSNIDLIHGNAEIGGIQDTAVTKSNPALFLESWSIMLRHGFEELRLNKIHGGTFHPHVVDALVRSFNFEVEGVRKKHVFKKNTYRDITLIGVFKDTVKYIEF